MKKIDYAVAAAAVFIHHLHRDGFDRGMIATFGSTFRVEQSFTSSQAYLYRALKGIRLDGSTRLYDSLEDVIIKFWRDGDRKRPWLLTVITDGQDNQSGRYKNNPAGIGSYIARHFNKDPNFICVIGVGTGQQIDARALVTMGQTGGFPPVTIAAFHLLEDVFMQIALQVSMRLVGRQINLGNLSWAEIARYYQVSQVPIDYAFLIDRSTSMDEVG